ncbi:MAG: hypothetical protein GW827_13910 [Flavobacteriales bacterium]|nr:hypothetical protein [Flavobacteriales bacterium]
MKTYEVKVHDNGDIYWYLNGQYHREDGPAIEFANGDIYWYLNGLEYTESQFNAKMHPVKELSIADIEKLLGYNVKIVKD